MGWVDDATTVTVVISGLDASGAVNVATALLNLVTAGLSEHR